MRLDLFLKWSRVILRRTLAKETCDAGRVTVNGQEARAGREVHVGDTVSLRLPRRQLKFRVRSIPVHGFVQLPDIIRADLMSESA